MMNRSNRYPSPEKSKPRQQPFLLATQKPRRKIAEILRAGELELDATRRLAWRGGEALPLTPAELSILEHLMRHPGVPQSREALAKAEGQTLPGEVDGPAADNIPAHISRLRRKLDEKWPVKLLETRRGAGYILRLP